MPVTARRLATIALLSVVAAAACAAEYTAAGAPRATASAPYRILVTNDDGIESPGLAALVEALAPLGEVTIVAPYENQSGIGHALNLREPIFLMRREVAGRPAVALSGTPATCVRVATDHLMKEAPPDLVVSGVNRGLNFGRNTYVSGTVAAAREAALQGIAAIAVSLAREAQRQRPGVAHQGITADPPEPAGRHRALRAPPQPLRQALSVELLRAARGRRRARIRHRRRQERRRRGHSAPGPRIGERCARGIVGPVRWDGSGPGGGARRVTRPGDLARLAT